VAQKPPPALFAKITVAFVFSPNIPLAENLKETEYKIPAIQNGTAEQQ
jgi:hypothetical protein